MLGMEGAPKEQGEGVTVTCLLSGRSAPFRPRTSSERLPTAIHELQRPDNAYAS